MSNDNSDSSDSSHGWAIGSSQPSLNQNMPFSLLNMQSHTSQNSNFQQFQHHRNISNPLPMGQKATRPPFFNPNAQFPSNEELEIIRHIPGHVLRAACNPCYMHVEKENLELKDKISALQNQLILTLQSKISSAPFITPPMSLPAPPTQTIAPAPKEKKKRLKQNDYPHVKYWDKPKTDEKAALVRITVTDTLEEDDDEDDEDDEDGPKNSGEKRIFAFLEDEHGQLISYQEKKRLYRFIRGWWDDNIDKTKIPHNWSSAGNKLLGQYYEDTEEEFPFLKLCYSHWKSDMLWQRNYHSWKKKKISELSTETISGRKRKRVKETDSDTNTVIPSTSDCGATEPTGDPEDNTNSETKKQKTGSTDNVKGKEVDPSECRSTLKNGRLPHKSQASAQALDGFVLDISTLDGDFQDTTNSSSSTSPPISVPSTSSAAGSTASNSAVSPTTTSTVPPITSTLSTHSRLSQQLSDPESVSRPLSPLIPISDSLHDPDQLVLKKLRNAVQSLPSSVPLADSSHILAAYNVDPISQLTQHIKNDDEIWEEYDSVFNNLIKHNPTDNYRLVTRGPFGLIGIVNLWDHFIQDRKMIPGVLRGKAERLLQAIEGVCASPPASDGNTESSSTEPCVQAAPLHVRPKEKGAGRGGTWKIPNTTIPKWECARERRATGLKESKKDFDRFWSAVESDPEKLKIYQDRCENSITSGQNGTATTTSVGN